MSKRFLFTAGVILVGVLGVSCVSPFYGTARIEEGWHMDAGVAATTFIGGPVGESPAYYTGARGDFELRYGFNKYLQAHGRIGLGLGYNFLHGNQPFTPGWDFSPLFDGALGIQTSIPFKYFTPALRLEFHGPLVSPILLFGIGKEERVTVGTDFTDLFYNLFGQAWPVEWNGFLKVQLSSQWAIFAGGGFQEVFTPYPVLTLGLGYKIK